MTYTTEVVVADRVSALRKEAEAQRRRRALLRIHRLRRRAERNAARARRARAAAGVQIARLS